MIQMPQMAELHASGFKFIATKPLLLTTVLVLLLMVVSASPDTPRALQQQSSSQPVFPAPPVPSPPGQLLSKQSGTDGTVSGPGGPVVPSGTTNSTLPPIGGTVIGVGEGGGTIIGGGQVVDPRRPVSRLSMVHPKQNTANPPLFPVGSDIVIEWAFDNTTLVFPPFNLTIEVNLSGNAKMIWPVANVSGSATSVVWNTAVVNPGLFMGFYTL